MKPLQRRTTAWIACLAILLMSFAPLVSAAVATLHRAAVVEICTADGTVLLADGAQHEQDEHAQHLQKHCPYCALHIDALPAVATSHVPAAAQLATYVAPAFLQGPRGTHTWAPAQSRAPPLSSRS